MQRSRVAFSLEIVTAALSLAIAACSSSTSEGNAGSGGDRATGGTPGSGGHPGTGGTTASGGRTGSGGTTGLGGHPETGGTTASGGRFGSGGVTDPMGQTGGTTAVAGRSGLGGASATGGRVGRDGGPGDATGGGGVATGGNLGADGGATVDGGGGGDDPVKSAGCGKTPTLKNGSITIQSGGASRMYVLQLPSNYDNNHPYRLILSYHGANGRATDIASGGFFGLANLSNNSTIFIAPDGVNTQWAAPRDTTFTSDILKQVEDALCIDTTRIELEGFSMGAAMVWSIVCNLKGTFRAAVGHSGGGVAAPSSCDPIPYLGSGGTGESGGAQSSQSDRFAKWNGCTVTTFPNPPAGGHICSDYTGCSAGHPVRWCLFDDGHKPDPKDSGKSSSWMPAEVWAFLSQF